jgi:hypothetical protein
MDWVGDYAIFPMRGLGEAEANKCLELQRSEMFIEPAINFEPNSRGAKEGLRDISLLRSFWIIRNLGSINISLLRSSNRGF